MVPEGTEFRAIKQRKLFERKLVWCGKYRYPGGVTWWYARSPYGAIAYATKEAALAGARVCAENPVK